MCILPVPQNFLLNRVIVLSRESGTFFRPKYLCESVCLIVQSDEIMVAKKKKKRDEGGCWTRLRGATSLAGLSCHSRNPPRALASGQTLTLDVSNILSVPCHIFKDSTPSHCQASLTVQRHTHTHGSLHTNNRLCFVCVVFIEAQIKSRVKIPT